MKLQCAGIIRLQEKDTEGGDTTQSQIIHNSEAVAICLSKASKLATTDLPIIIQGETGVGKELFAHLIHENSSRKDETLFVVDCGALTDGNLAKSTLFGHKKGCFTGATDDVCGIFEHSNGATVFMDEIGELPGEIQVALLRILQDGSFLRIGETKKRKTNVRIIAASNKELSDEVSQGNFRKDLFYRLAGALIEIPPLRERKSDIPVLAEHFKNSVPKKDSEISFSQETKDLMEKYPWPGNVRELKMTVQRAVALCGGKEINPRDLELLSPNNLDPNDCLDSAFEKIKKIVERNPISDQDVELLERINFLSAMKNFYGESEKIRRQLKINKNRLVHLKRKHLSQTV